jgi:urea transport system substrate-binding protein
VGSDYVYPRTVNDILIAYLTNEKGVLPRDITVHYAPLGSTAWENFIVELKYFAAGGGKTGVISTINGDSNIHFYLALAKAQIDSAELPVLGLSIGEEEIVGIDTAPLVGHLGAASYFMSVDYSDNRRFVNVWQAYARNKRRVTKDPMEAHRIGFSLWVKAVEAAGTTDADAVIDEMVGLSVPNLTGGTATMLPNHHITKPVYIGKIGQDGQFEVVWHSRGEIAADAWSDHLPETRDLIADWRPPISCGRYNTATSLCEDENPPQQAGQSGRRSGLSGRFQ